MKEEVIYDYLTLERLDGNYSAILFMTKSVSGLT